MKTLLRGRKDVINTHIRQLDDQISRIERELNTLDRFVTNPAPPKRWDESTLRKLLGQAILPESKKRFVSYLSTGSFQTIGLRKHELKRARIKTALMVLGVIIGIFLILYLLVYPVLR